MVRHVIRDEDRYKRPSIKSLGLPKLMGTTDWAVKHNGKTYLDWRLAVDSGVSQSDLMYTFNIRSGKTIKAYLEQDKEEQKK